MKNYATFFQFGSRYYNTSNHKSFGLEELKNLILSGFNIAVIHHIYKRRVTKNVLAQILFLNHATPECEKSGYVKKRSIKSLHNEIRILAPFEEQNIHHYKNYENTKKYVNPHNIVALN